MDMRGHPRKIRQTVFVESGHVLSGAPIGREEWQGVRTPRGRQVSASLHCYPGLDQRGDRGVQLPIRLTARPQALSLPRHPVLQPGRSGSTLGQHRTPNSRTVLVT